MVRVSKKEVMIFFEKKEYKKEEKSRAINQHGTSYNRRKVRDTKKRRVRVSKKEGTSY